MFGMFKKKSQQMQMGSREANDVVRAKLRELGDEGTHARHVIHFAYPLGAATVEDVKAIKAHLSKLGFRVKNAVNEAGLSFENHQAVYGDDFDHMTFKLGEFFDQFDWEYDGWECAVVGR